MPVVARALFGHSGELICPDLSVVELEPFLDRVFVSFGCDAQLLQLIADLLFGHFVDLSVDLR